MRFSRRELAVLLPALAGEEQKTEGQQVNEQLQSAGYDFGSLPERTSANGKMKSRSVFAALRPEVNGSQCTSADWRRGKRHTRRNHAHLQRNRP